MLNRAGPNPLAPFTTLRFTLSQEHNCVVLASGGVMCWGGNSYSQVSSAHIRTRSSLVWPQPCLQDRVIFLQLGLGDSANRNTPTALTHSALSGGVTIIVAGYVSVQNVSRVTLLLHVNMPNS